MSVPNPLPSQEEANAAFFRRSREDWEAIGGHPSFRGLGSGSGEAGRVSQVSQPCEPEPLRRPLPPPKPYPIDSLGPVLAAAARRIHEVVRAPDALCGQSVLAAASLAAQAQADVLIDGRRELLSIAAASISDSGERKTGTDRVALHMHREFERAALERYAAEKLTHSVELQAWETATRAVGKGQDVDAIADSLKKLGAAPEAPLKPLLLVGTPTLEGIHRLYTIGQPSIGLFHDDAAEFFGGHAMSQENRAKAAAGLSKLWDIGEFDRVRSGEGAEKYFGRRLATHLMMQPVIAESILSDPILTGQGFLARSLLAWPTSTIGSRDYVEVDLYRDTDLGCYWSRMRELLARPLPLRAETRNELEPRSLALSPEAKRLWIVLHDSIERDMRDGGDFASIRAWASKAPSQVLRISGVLSLVANSEAHSIDADNLDRAATLMAFHLSEASRIVGTCAVPPAIRNAEALLAWCHQTRRKLLHSGAALQFGPSAIRHKQVFDTAIGELERAGWATSIKDGCEIDGRHRRRAWCIYGVAA